MCVGSVVCTLRVSISLIELVHRGLLTVVASFAPFSPVLYRMGVN